MIARPLNADFALAFPNRAIAWLILQTHRFTLSGQSAVAGRAKATSAAAARRQFPDLIEIRPFHFLKYKLGNAISSYNPEIVFSVVDEDYFNLAPVVAIDCTGAVKHRYSMSGSEPGSWPHLGFIAGWYCHLQAGGDERMGARCEVLSFAFINRRQKINARCARRLIGRQIKVPSMFKPNDVYRKSGFFHF